MQRNLVAFRRFAHYKPQRSSKYAQLSQGDLEHFSSILPQPGSILSPLLKTAREEMEPFNVDWLKKYRGQSSVILKPRTTEQVSAILRHCNERRLAVVPQGGNTGLVGGGVPVFDEVVISTQLMNKIQSFQPVSGVLVCQAGCVLEALDNHVAESGFIMPLDLGAKGSCHIGGNLATNAGGLRLLRYGSLHGSVLGIEAVLPDGTILDNLSLLRKDNTGYDLKQLFIGAEGTLGMITGVSILCPPRPKAVNVAVLGVESFEKVQKIFKDARSRLAEILSAFEFWDRASHQMVHAIHPQVKTRPSSIDAPFYVLIETSGSNKEHDDEKLNDLLEYLMENDIVTDGTVAQDTTQLKQLWQIREGIPEACSMAGSVLKYDISLPLASMYKLVQDITTRLQNHNLYNSGMNLWNPTDKPVLGVIGYGHMGDGNLHLNIAVRSYSPEVVDAVEPFVYEQTQNVGGSISAEHGLGLMKAPYIHYSKSPSMVKTMQLIKSSFDPNGIMNPYKFVLTDQE